MSSQQPERVEYSAEVESRWKSFQTFFDKNRAVIVNRWLAMNDQQRIDLLAANWKQSGKRDSEKGSEMPEHHRPDLMEVVPWRDDSNKYKRLLPLNKNLDENHQRWPDFNQEDLTKRKESFLTMLSYRAQEHPCEFAQIDCYRENKMIAANEGLTTLEDSDFYAPGMVLVTMASGLDEGDPYGTRYFPSDRERFKGLQEAGVWAEVPAISVMVNQRRIYQFLQSMVLRIGLEQSYKVANETIEPEWVPLDPDLDDSRLSDPGYQAQLNTYVDFFRDTMHFTAINHKLIPLAFGICLRHFNSYSARLKALKSSPRFFYSHISDIREHSHHEITYASNNQNHRWVSHVNLLGNAAIGSGPSLIGAWQAAYNNNLRNPEMFGTYLIKALHDLTEGYNCWSNALSACWNLAKELDKEDPDLQDYLFFLVYLYNILLHRSQLEDLRTTLGCSRDLRKYFRNASFDDNNPKAETVGNRRLPTKDTENKQVTSLISLLKVLREKDVYDAISLESDGWADEIVTLCHKKAKDGGGRWMTNFATDKAEESRDSIGAFLAIKRIWDKEDLARTFKPEDFDLWENYRKEPDRLRAIDPEEKAFNAIVSKHMIPNPNLKFDYPEIKDDQQVTKRREHAATRKASERNLAALWADLQPFLVEKQALSLPAIEALNSVIPLTTDDDGEDIVLEQPPPPPETPVQDEANSPSTPPPGPSDPGDPSTPTQLLGGFSFTSPPRQGPARRSPEKKTKDDGVKKTRPPTRRASPPPRRPPTERRREREARRQLLEQEAAAAAPIPGADPGPAERYPKIELPSKQYALLKSIMTTDAEKRPGTVPWNDIIGIFLAIGFSTYVEGRNSRGSLQVFVPSEELRRTQGIDKHVSRDRPHGPNLDFGKARHFFRGSHGFGKFTNWTFDHFKEAGT